MSRAPLTAVRNVEGSLPAIPLACSIAQCPISVTQARERVGDLAVLTAVLTLVDGEGSLQQIPLVC